MSLINDALKRAGQGDTPPLPPMEVMQPVHYPRSAKWPLILLPLILVSVLSVAIWFVMKGYQTAQHEKAVPVTTIAARSVPTAPAITVPPAAPVVVAKEPTVEVPKPKEPAVVAPAVPAVPSFPKLKLQAVFYRAHNPSVVINTRALRVGDSIDNARIVSISRETVVVEWGGETRSLVLP